MQPRWHARRRQRIVRPADESETPDPIGPGAPRPRGERRTGVAAKRILLVEDDRGIRDVVKGILLEEGYDVTVAVNGREALDRLRAGCAPDLIVLDLRMPVMDGWEFRAAQKNDPALACIPVVAISADGSAKAEAIAAHAYLRKPVSSTSLLNTIRRVLLDTERIRLLGMVEEADRFAALGRLAATVGHEVNNPLAYTSMNLELATRELASMLASDEVDPHLENAGFWLQLARLHEMLAEARLGLERISSVVKDLQSLSRTQPAKRELFSLNDLLDESLGMARVQLVHRATVVREYGALPLFTGHRSAMGQVFLNLILNAAQALPSGRARTNSITVATSVLEDGLTVEFRDTGAGIPPDILPHIFDSFYTTKPVGEGTGLGLAVSSRIVTDHGGRIQVDSEVGRGTTVRVILPVPVQDADPAPTEMPAVVAGGPPRRARILVIDDEPLLGRIVESGLAGEHDVIVAVRAAEALTRLAAGETFDVILCDLLMPELGGREIHERLISDWPHLAPNLVFMTGGAFTPDAEEFLKQNSNRLLSKPFSFEELRAIIRAQLDERLVRSN